MSVGIVGYYDLTDYNLFERCLLTFEATTPIAAIITGNCRGTNLLAIQYAKVHDKKLIIHETNRKEQSKRIVEDSQYLIAFKSQYSNDTIIRIAKQKDVPVIIINI